LVVLVVLTVGCSSGGAPFFQGGSPVDEEALRAAHEFRLVYARQHCVPIPVSLADQIADGLVGYIPGQWRGRPGSLVVIDYVTMTAFRWPPTDHVVRVGAAIPNTQGGFVGNVSFLLLVQGSLDAPESIMFLTNSVITANPTGFETVVRDAWPYYDSTFCGEVGAEAGPYRTDQLGAG
jgi:hypothetical protein